MKQVVLKVDLKEKIEEVVEQAGKGALKRGEVCQAQLSTLRPALANRSEWKHLSEKLLLYHSSALDEL